MANLFRCGSNQNSNLEYYLKGSVDVEYLSGGWNYITVNFSKPFTNIPNIYLHTNILKYIK